VGSEAQQMLCKKNGLVKRTRTRSPHSRKGANDAGIDLSVHSNPQNGISFCQHASPFFEMAFFSGFPADSKTKH